MERMREGMTWKQIAMELTKDFRKFGCRFSGKALREIALGYDCTPLYFWNWMEDPEGEKSEKGFLRVLGYAWRKCLEEEAETVPVKAAVKAEPCGRKAA